MRYLLLLLLLCQQFASCGVIQNYKEKIPSEDFLEIENFFCYLMLEGQFAYTLFGDKPISTIGIFKRKNIYSILLPNTHDRVIYQWSIWKKYASTFQSKNYLIISNESSDLLEIYLINRNACKKIICENLILFQDVLGTEATPEAILKSIETSQQIAKEALKGSQLLYGILLGYGVSNAYGFEQIHRYQNYILKPPKPFHEECLSGPVLIQLPFFMVFHQNSETIKLKEVYCQKRKEICSIFNSKGGLLTALKKYLNSE